MGHKEVPGRPALFATTPHFLDYFNLISLGDLPPLQEFIESLTLDNNDQPPPAPEMAPNHNEGNHTEHAESIETGAIES